MFAQEFRSSKSFVKIVVCFAVFTDVFLYGLIVPSLPFALTERLGLPESLVQRWNSILLGTYGAAILLGSCRLQRFLHIPIAGFSIRHCMLLTWT
jgi:predicted naringenin-chalcone synthase